MLRRWRVPPPPFGGFEAADGAAVLDENAGGLGVLLWDAARDVVLWATSPANELPELFAPAAERMRSASLLSAQLDPALEPAFSVLARIVGRSRYSNRERAALACRQVSQWADSQGAIATAAAFAHAAAIAAPGDALLSYEAGRLARRGADYGQAQVWLTRAVLLGRQLKDWDSCINARGGLGNLYIQRGNYPRAERYHRRAWWLAQRYGRRELEGRALHSLCLIATQREQLDDLTALARAAYVAYGHGHARIPVLAHDVAYAWMEQGCFEQALKVFEATRPHIPEADRVQVIAGICRAAAGAGRLDRFEAAWAELGVSNGAAPQKDHVAEAFLDAARAAGQLRLWDKAEMAARLSLKIATERQEARIQISAEAMLEAILREHAAEVSSVPVEGDTAEEVHALADDLIEALTTHAAAGV